MSRRNIIIVLVILAAIAAFLIFWGWRCNNESTTTGVTLSLEQRVSNLETRVSVLEAALGITTTTTTIPPPTTTSTATTTTTVPPTTSTSQSTTTQTLPPTSTTSGGYTASGPLTLKSGSAVQDKSFTGTPPNSIAAISGSGVGGASISHVTSNGTSYLLKIGSGSQSSNIIATGLTCTNNSQGIFVANVANSTFSDFNIQAQNPAWGGKPHGIYVEKGNSQLLFQRGTLTALGTAGQTIHLYADDTSQPTSYITFDDVTVGTAAKPVRVAIVASSFSYVTFRNLKAYSLSSDPVFALYGGAHDILIQDCELWGGSSIVGVTGGSGPAVNVTLKNVIYHGTKVSAGSITNLVQQNVTLVP